VVMIFGGIVQATMGVEAARRDLEDIAPPLSVHREELGEPGEEADPYTLGRGQARGTEHAPQPGQQTQPAAPRPGPRDPEGGDR
jgi:hypothetical protein